MPKQGYRFRNETGPDTRPEIVKVVVILEIEIDRTGYNLDYNGDESITDIKWGARQDAREAVEYANISHPWFKSVRVRNP